MYFMSFLPLYCHFFRTTVIPSGFLSFLPVVCRFFQIFVIPSKFLSFLPNIVIPSQLLPFQIYVILNSSSTFPYPKGEKIGKQSRPYLQVCIKQKESQSFAVCTYIHKLSNLGHTHNLMSICILWHGSNHFHNNPYRFCM